MIFWFDCETTGLDENKDDIFEVAVLVTDDGLNIIEEYQAVIFANQTTLEKMNDWAKSQHQLSGLISDCRNSLISLSEAEEKVLEIINRNFPAGERPVLSGSSIHFDRGFIAKFLPKLHTKLHYRHLDVSSFIYGLSKVKLVNFERKMKATHRAMPDIKDSLAIFKEIVTRFN
jgi:oligoribonuclease